MALRRLLILRRPQSGRLEGRTTLIQARRFPDSLLRRDDGWVGAIRQVLSIRGTALRRAGAEIRSSTADHWHAFHLAGLALLLFVLHSGPQDGVYPGLIARILPEMLKHLSI